MISLYVLMIGHIPLIAFLHEPTWILGIWLVGLGMMGVMLWWVLYRFSWEVLGVWIGLVLAVHGAVFWVEGVRLAFDVDRCLDSGGMWRDGICEF